MRKPFKKLLPFSALIFSLLYSQSTWAINNTFVHFGSFNHSEPIAIKAFAGDWDSKFSGGTKALSLSQIELGFTQGNWKYSVFQRQDYLLQFSEDTAEFYYNIENKLPLDEGREYQLELDSQSFVATGLKVAFQDNWQQIDWQLGISYLQGSKLTDGSINGAATYINDKDYNFNFDVDYYYDNDVLFDRNIEQAPEGHGYAIDLTLGTQINDRWSVKFQAKDLLAQIFWNNTPRTVATSDSDTKTYDEDGYVIFNPVASGTESTEDFTQRIPIKLNLSSTYRITPQHSIKFGYRNLDVAEFYNLAYQYHTPHSRFDVGYYLSAQAWSLSYQRSWFKLQLLTDDLDWQEAKTLGVNLGLSYRF
ncbi:DUF5723 domain-containing protein [uncultured Thiomicrorhabdus sp.]